MLHTSPCREACQLDQEQKPRERSFISELVPDWRPTKAQVLWAIRITIVFVIVLGILTLIGLPFGISLWGWVKLLIVPAVIAGGGLWFNAQQREREQRIANERAQDEALQAYLDAMSQLLTDKDQPLHRAQPGDSLSTVARAMTLTVLARLDGSRKGSVLQFLHESGLLSRERPILTLSGADLSRAELDQKDLSRASLREANLHRVRGVTVLRDADLSGTNLTEANLTNMLPGIFALGSELSGADLSKATLVDTNLSGATLSEAWLSEADLSGANLSGANLSGAYLGAPEWSKEFQDAAWEVDHLGERPSERTGTNLSEANLSKAVGLTDEQIAAARSLEGAIMPNGQKYEDWLKSKDREGDGQNDGSS